MATKTRKIFGRITKYYETYAQYAPYINGKKPSMWRRVSYLPMLIDLRFWTDRPGERHQNLFNAKQKSKKRYYAGERLSSLKHSNQMRRNLWPKHQKYRIILWRDWRHYKRQIMPINHT